MWYHVKRIFSAFLLSVSKRKEVKMGNFSKILDNSTYFRFGFVLFLLLIVLISIVLPNNDNFFMLYIISVIFLGIGFYNKPVFLIVLTVLTVACRYYFVPNAEESTFFIFLITYFLVTFISAGMMKYVQRAKNHTLELKLALVNALDSRDRYTSHHSENVSKYAVQIAEKMKLSKDLCNTVRVGGLLHDIGKIGIPEHILNKSGKLSEDEYNIIKSHPTIGFEMLRHVADYKKNGVLDIVLYHHERYDGKGYPKGLKGDEIPLAARIVAVADTFDAMVSKRVYRNEMDLTYTLNEIRQNRGTQFDPEITDAFLSIFQETDIKVDYSEIKLVKSDKNFGQNS
jgi:putative nucleotidyltransferase with HDIG domain